MKKSSKVNTGSVIKKIPQKDFGEWTRIVADAYPGMEIETAERLKQVRDFLIKMDKIDPAVQSWGLYRKGKLIGGYRLFDFVMNFYETKMPIGGGGLLAVDLANKKEKVAYELMQHFLYHYRDKGAALATLYPFRPDFYRKMGFGYGAKSSTYRIKPGDLPKDGSKERVRFLTNRDLKAVGACYDRFALKTHGMFDKCKYELMRMEKPSVRIIGYKKDRKLQGYVSFIFKKVPGSNFVLNDLFINEMVYENREALAGMLTFLRTQADQINQIIYNTHEENFHFVPRDPRDGSNEMTELVSHQVGQQGVGIMYRVIDTPGFFRQLRKHSFNGVDCKVRFSVRDTFIKENDKSLVVHFVGGKPRIKRSGDYEVELSMDMAEFSSMVLGVVDFKSLYMYSKAEISDAAYVPVINKLFGAETKPGTITQF